jgi:VWFA-related protein
MSGRRSMLLTLLTLAALAWAIPPRTRSASAASPQSAGQSDATASTTIRTESKLVLVDVVVTDKKGGYIRDLVSRDFHVYEDNDEQSITSFSSGTQAKAPDGSALRRYMVLFFDNSTMDLADQARARQAASQFVEKMASNEHLMAVVDFTGSVKIEQNFTANSDSLKRAVAGVKFSAIQANSPAVPTEVAALGAVSLGSLATDFGAHTMLLALRSLAKNLRNVPGRKSVVLFSAGFPLSYEAQSELTATIDACNKSNMAIYPLDLWAPCVRRVSPGRALGVHRLVRSSHTTCIFSPRY